MDIQGCDVMGTWYSCVCTNPKCHYREHFKDKIVLCNCDDPRESKFFTYFSLNFEFLGLKRLICIGYKENGHGVKYVYEGDKNKNGIVDPEEIEVIACSIFASSGSFTTISRALLLVTVPTLLLITAIIAIPILKRNKSNRWDG